MRPHSALSRFIRRTTRLVITLAVLLPSGCSPKTNQEAHHNGEQPQNAKPAVAQIQSHYVVLDRVPRTTVRVMLGDKEVGRRDFNDAKNQHLTSIQVSEALHETWGTKGVTVLALSPEGWIDMIESVPPSQLKGREYEYRANCKALNNCTIWIDNRDGPATSLSCGEITRDIPGKAALVIQFPTPGKRTPIKVEGQELAALDASSQPCFFVLDVMGGHAYTVRTVQYGGRDFQDLVKSGALKLNNQPRVLKGQRWYPVSRLDFFLELPPVSVAGTEHEIKTRTVLTDYDPQKDPK